VLVYNHDHHNLFHNGSNLLRFVLCLPFVPFIVFIFLFVLFLFVLFLVVFLVVIFLFALFRVCNRGKVFPGSGREIREAPFY
jgi:hypothetical protein